MEEITKWYADKIGKTPNEFDAIDKHIETVIQTWEKERNQALTIPVVVVRSEQLVCNCDKWHDRMEESNNNCSTCDKPIK